MQSKKSVSLFVHGGPGLHSFVEERELGPSFSEKGLSLFYWNEPSSHRPNGPRFSKEKAFDHWIDSVRAECVRLAAEHGPIHLIAHSFGVQGALWAIERASESIARLTLISPGFLIHSAQKNVIRLALNEIGDENPTQTAELRECLTLSRSAFDSWAEKGMATALATGRIFPKYFASQEAFFRWAQLLQDVGTPMDTASLEAVGKTFHAYRRWPQPLSIPVQLIFGEKEVIVSKEEEISEARQLFRNVQIVELPDSAHFPHLEQPSLFVEKVARFLEA